MCESLESGSRGPRGYKKAWQGSLVWSFKGNYLVILYHSFSLAALVFNWSSAMTCSTFARVKKVNSSARAPPWRNWQKQILRNISSVPIIRALFGPCAWRWLRRGTTFEWSQQIRKQIYDLSISGRQTILLFMHLSTISSCSLSEISRVSTWYATTRLQIWWWFVKWSTITDITSKPKSIIMTMERGELRRFPVRPGEPLQSGKLEN